AIGKSGQNVRLAARLTGWRIDIRSEAQVVKATLIAATSPDGAVEEEAVVSASAAIELPEEMPMAVTVEKKSKAKPEPEPEYLSEEDEDIPDDSLPMLELPDFPAHAFEEVKS